MEITDSLRAPRQIFKWFDKLNLQYSIKSFNRDLRNGIFVGQILKQYDINFNTLSLVNENNKEVCDQNWKILQKKFLYLGFVIKDLEIEKLKFFERNIGLKLIIRMYEYFTNSKINFNFQNKENYEQKNMTLVQIVKQKRIQQMMDVNKKRRLIEQKIKKFKNFRKQVQEKENIKQYIEDRKTKRIKQSLASLEKLSKQSHLRIINQYIELKNQKSQKKKSIQLQRDNTICMQEKFIDILYKNCQLMGLNDFTIDHLEYVLQIALKIEPDVFKTILQVFRSLSSKISVYIGHSLHTIKYFLNIVLNFCKKCDILHSQDIEKMFTEIFIELKSDQRDLMNLYICNTYVYQIQQELCNKFNKNIAFLYYHLFQRSRKCDDFISEFQFFNKDFQKQFQMIHFTVKMMLQNQFKNIKVQQILSVLKKGYFFNSLIVKITCLKIIKNCIKFNLFQNDDLLKDIFVQSFRIDDLRVKQVLIKIIRFSKAQSDFFTKKDIAKYVKIIFNVNSSFEVKKIGIMHLGFLIDNNTEIMNLYFDILFSINIKSMSLVFAHNIYKYAEKIVVFLELMNTYIEKQPLNLNQTNILIFLIDKLLIEKVNDICDLQIQRLQFKVLQNLHNTQSTQSILNLTLNYFQKILPSNIDQQTFQDILLVQIQKILYIQKDSKQMEITRKFIIDFTKVNNGSDIICNILNSLSKMDFQQFNFLQLYTILNPLVAKKTNNFGILQKITEKLIQLIFIYKCKKTNLKIIHQIIKTSVQILFFWKNNYIQVKEPTHLQRYQVSFTKYFKKKMQTYYQNLHDPIYVYFKEKIANLLTSNIAADLMELKEEENEQYEIEKLKKMAQINFDAKKKLRNKMVDFKIKLNSVQLLQPRKQISQILDQNKIMYNEVSKHMKRELDSQESIFRSKMQQRIERSKSRNLNLTLQKSQEIVEEDQANIGQKNFKQRKSKSNNELIPKNFDFEKIQINFHSLNQKILLIMN